jgi:hypothetical protein
MTYGDIISFEIDVFGNFSPADEKTIRCEGIFMFNKGIVKRFVNSKHHDFFHWLKF